MQPHTWPIDPHLNSFLRDVLVDLGGGVLVETMQKHLKRRRKGKATVNTFEPPNPPSPGIKLRLGV